MSAITKESRATLPGQPPVPFFVRHLYAICALSSLMTFPLIGLEYALIGMTQRYFHDRWPSHHLGDPPIFAVCLVAFCLAAGIPWFYGTWSASRFIVHLVRFYLRAERPDLAEEALLAFCNQLWYRHLKADNQLVDFVLEKRIETKRDRYHRFLARMNKLQ